MSIKLTNCTFVGQTKAGINFDADTKEEINLDNSHFRDQPIAINVYSSSLMKKLGLNEDELFRLLSVLKTGNQEEFEHLVNILKNSNPEERLGITIRKHFFQKS